MLSKCKENRNKSAGSVGRLKESEDRLKEQMCGGFLKKPSGFTLYISRFFLCSGLLRWEKKTSIWHQEFLKELNINLKTWVWADQTTKRHFVILILICSRWHLSWKCCWILHHPYAKYTIFHFLLIPFPKPPSIPSTPPNLAIKVSLA